MLREALRTVGTLVALAVSTAWLRLRHPLRRPGPSYDHRCEGRCAHRSAGRDPG